VGLKATCSLAFNGQTGTELLFMMMCTWTIKVPVSDFASVYVYTLITMCFVYILWNAFFFLENKDGTGFAYFIFCPVKMI